MRVRGVVVLLLVLALGGTAGAIWIGSQRMLYPPWYEHPRPPPTDPARALGLAFQEVEFSTVSGATLRGWWVPGSSHASGGVLTVHGAGGDRTNFLAEAKFLHEAGYPVLLFDLSEHGTSDGAARGLGLGHRESHDVSAAVTYAKRERGLGRVAVLGGSMGAVAALLAAARDPQIDAVIAENPWARLEHMTEAHRPGFVPEGLTDAIRALTLWRLGALDEPDPLDVIAHIAPRPLLLIHGSADTMIPASESEALFAAAGEPAALWIAEGADHIETYEYDPEGFRERVLDFLGRWVAPPCG